MKILITTDLFTTKTNGVVTSVMNLRDELMAKGHEVRILTLSDNMKSRREGDVYYIRSVPCRVYPNVRVPTSFRHKLIYELIEWSPDVIHSQCEFFSFQYALRISKHTGAPIVHTYHTLYEQYVAYLIPGKRLGNTVVRMFSRRRLKKVDRVIAPTHKVEDALHSYGVNKIIDVVPSGIALSQHQKRMTEEKRAAKREALGISSDKNVLVNLGRLGTEKNIGELIELFARAAEKNDSLVFLIVGDGPAREELEHKAKELGVEDKVIFTGMVDPASVQEYYQLGDLFVSASTSETQGLTYVEAAANGLPLLCRKDRCLDDVIIEGGNGYEYTSAEEFLEEIANIAADPEWRRIAGKKSEEIAAAFDKSSFGEAVEKVYESVLK